MIHFERGWWIPEAIGADRRHPALAQQHDVGVIDLACTWVREHEVVLQAGARIGLFPCALSWRFKQVLAFEPDADNFDCCVRNCRGRPITVQHAALGKDMGTAQLVPAARPGESRWWFRKNHSVSHSPLPGRRCGHVVPACEWESDRG